MVCRKYLARWQEVIKIEKIKCPYCGHEQKARYTPNAKCKGVFIKCQARHCKKVFEIKINEDK